jgi:hypothetical protein
MAAFRVMTPNDCKIGMDFWSDGGHCRCTRTVIAIKLNQLDTRNYSGPPYMVAESVLDEFDLKTCYLTREERDAEFDDVDDGPDLSATVTSVNGELYREGLENKMVIELDDAEFQRAQRLYLEMRSGAASEEEKEWLVRRVVRESYPGFLMYHKPSSSTGE